jgi:hypothetical protein
MPLVIIGIMAILSAFMMEQNCPEREDDEPQSQRLTRAA